MTLYQITVYHNDESRFMPSLSVGDVIAIAASPADTCWLVCDTIGWKHIGQPANIAGVPLTAEKVYQHLHELRRPR